MNKRYKLLSLLLCAGIVASALPSSGTGATSDSIAFYNSKKSILEMKEYDEVYDTNHDGVVNVFDVIRENKEVFQEESYTDLKSQIHSLETQIEILTQKLAEKEDKTQAESNLSEIYSALSGKTNQQDGKQLISNDYTDEDKQKLENLNNYDDTKIKSELSELSGNLSFKVDKEEDKQLSSNDFTDAEKQKLESLNNYDDTSIKSDISEISSSLSGKIDNQEGKQLSTNDYTDEDKNKLSSLENYNDKDIKLEISSINSELSSINDSVSCKVDRQDGKQLSSNDYTDSDKEKLKNLENYDDTKINDKIDLLVQAAYEEKKEIETSIDNKVDKEEGKQLSSNDYTNEEKQKLESLNNYDDTDIKEEINNIKDTYLNDVVYIGYGTNYSIKEGLAYAVENNLTAIITKGVYDLVSEGINGEGNKLPKHLIGYGATLKADLPAENWEWSPLNVDPDRDETIVEGLTIEVSNCRYCIHDEMYSRSKPYHNVFKNLRLVHKTGATSKLIAPHCIGGGLGNGGIIEIENVIADANLYKDISYHSCAGMPTTINRVYVKNSIVKHCVEAVHATPTTPYAEQFVNKVYVSGCILGRQPLTDIDTSIQIIAWNNTIDENIDTN